MVLALRHFSECSYREIGEVKQKRPVLDKTALDSTGASKNMPGDNHDPGTINLEFYWDAKATPPSITADPETITLTLPKSVAASAAGATCIGTGYFAERPLTPKLSRNNVNMGSAVVQFDGGTGPAYTPEA